MIACVSPGQSSADHTINTLRYAERLKEKNGGNYAEALLPNIKPEVPVKPVVNGEENKSNKETEEEEDNDLKDKFSTSAKINSTIGNSTAAKDWEYLKQTINEKEGKQFDKEDFERQEKADAIFDEEEKLFNLHVAYLKEDARLLTEEGQLINKLQSKTIINNETKIWKKNTMLISIFRRWSQW
jgi:kinesin family protein 2/24